MNRRRRFRRNPREGGGRQENDLFGGYVIPGVIGAVGAIAFDVFWGYVEPQLPSEMQTGWVATVAELAALWVAVKALDSAEPRWQRRTHAAALGAATVIAYNALEGVAAQVLPAGTPGLSGYMPGNRYQLGGLGRNVGRRGMHGYMPRTFAGNLGDLQYSPAATLQAGGGGAQFAGLDASSLDDGMDN